MSRDLYEELGLPRDATPEDIRAAYRRKARKEHPDKGGSTEAFQALTKAYIVLRDPERRKEYDASGYTEEVQEPYQRALKEVAMLVLHFLSNLDSDRIDMVTHLKNVVTASKERMQQQLRNVEAGIAKRERAFKRVSGGKGENLIAGFIRNDIDNHVKAIAELQRQLAEADDMLDILKDYKYLADAPPGPTVSVTYTTSGWPPGGG